MSYSWLAGIAGFLLTLVGAAFVGSRLNEGKHRKIEVKEKNDHIVDLTGWIIHNDKIDKQEKKALLSRDRLDADTVSKLLSKYPEAPSDPKAKKTRKTKSRRKVVSRRRKGR